MVSNDFKNISFIFIEIIFKTRNSSHQTRLLYRRQTHKNYEEKFSIIQN